MPNGSSRKRLILSVTFLLGMIGWVYAGMPWGIFTANFVYLLGITQGILAIVILLWLLGVKWAGSYFVPAGIVTLSYAPIAFLAILGLLDGQGEVFFWSQSPGHSSWFTPLFFFTRNLGGFIIFYAVVSHTLFRYSRDQTREPGRLCFLLALFVLNQTIIAWDFGMNLWPGWHSTIFAPSFWFGDLYAGLAILMYMVISSKNKITRMPTWDNMRKLLFAFSILWAYLWWSQFITIWYANIPAETGPLYAGFSGGYALLSGLMFLSLFLIPFGTLLIDRGKRISLRPILGIILFGSWIERYLIVIPPIVRFHETTGQARDYSTWSTALTTVGVISGFLLLLSLCSGLVAKFSPAARIQSASTPD